MPMLVMKDGATSSVAMPTTVNPCLYTRHRPSESRGSPFCTEGHQLAQKLTRTTFSLKSESCTLLPDRCGGKTPARFLYSRLVAAKVSLFLTEGTGTSPRARQ